MTGRHNFASEQGVGIEKPIRPSDFVFAAFRSAEEVFVALNSFGEGRDALTGYFRPGGFQLSEPPLFEVNFGWARRNLTELCLPSGRALSLTTRDGAVGAYTVVVCGYQDRDADEEVFELAYWGNSLE